MHQRAIEHAFASAAASALSTIIFYPFETVRLQMHSAIADNCTKRRMRRRQSMNDPIYTLQAAIRSGGMHSLYRGLLPTIGCISVSQFTYFFLYQALKARCSGTGVVSQIGAATLASFASTIITTPVWSIGMQLKFDKAGYYKQSVAHCLRDTVRNRGVAAFYEGLVPSIWQICGPVIQNIAYEKLRGAMAAARPEGAAWVELFVIGAISKLLSTLATYPMQVAQNVLFAQSRRLRKQAKEGVSAGTGGTGGEDSDSRYSGTGATASKPATKLTTLSCLLQIANDTGIQGLYRGLTVKLCQTVLNGALMFVLYEKILVLMQVLAGYSTQL